MVYWGMSLESLLASENFTLEEVLDEENVIQGCKLSSTALVNYLEGREQVKQMVQYVVNPPTDERDFKYAFVSCSVLTSEVNSILKTLVEDEELMILLFSFLESDHDHGSVLAGYFSKVVITLLLRKTEEVMCHIQKHPDILKKLVDLVGVTSIMEVLLRLVGADDQIYTYHSDAVQWLAETELLQMLVDKLSSSSGSEDHSNAANTMCAVMRLPQSALALELSSPSFVNKLVTQGLENSQTKSCLVHTLSVCISILEPRRASAGRIKNSTELLHCASPDTIDVMVQKLGDVLNVLDTSNDKTLLPTTYGELRPPFGTHRLKVVEFVSVLIRADAEKVGQALIQLKGLQLLLKHFFDYPFNNMLHHLVENIILTCMESNSEILIDHLFKDCDFIGALLAVDRNPLAPDTRPESKRGAKPPPRVGNIGHVTRIANKLLQVESRQVQSYLQKHSSWTEWKSSVLLERNATENVYQWACGRPVAIQNRSMGSDEDDYRDRDYDVSTMASNLTREVFRYGMFDNDDAEEDVYFDNDSSEVVINSLRLDDEQESARLFGTNSPWSFFQDVKALDLGSSPPRGDEDDVDDINFSLKSATRNEDEVVVGEDDDLADTATSSGDLQDAVHLDYGVCENGEVSLKQEMDHEEFLHMVDKLCLLNARSMSLANNRGGCQFDGGTEEGAEEGRDSDAAVDQVLVFDMDIDSDTRNDGSEEGEPQVSGVEPEGTAKAMEKALREGVVGEAAPLHHNSTSTPTTTTTTTSKSSERDDSVTTDVVVEFNDVNYWRSEYDHSIADLEKM